MAQTLHPLGNEPAGVAVNGTAIRAKRKLAGLYMAELAGKCGISEGYVSHIELGRRQAVSPPVFAALCDALGVNDRSELLAADGPTA
ncbi:MAG: helix-turn-helix transcriptional regulator [Umezawaea sp.]